MPGADQSAIAEESELERLRTENAGLRQRVVAAESAIEELRADAFERRQQVRALAADLPVAMSRKTLLRQVVGDALHHPDKGGVAVRVVNKARRTVRGAVRRAVRR
ncbi:MAG: hypothetical protein ABIW84_04040 [Ilumatobacteraceae bacterium]